MCVHTRRRNARQTRLWMFVLPPDEVGGREGGELEAGVDLVERQVFLDVLGEGHVIGPRARTPEQLVLVEQHHLRVGIIRTISTSSTTTQQRAPSPKGPEKRARTRETEEPSHLIVWRFEMWVRRTLSSSCLKTTIDRAAERSAATIVKLRARTLASPKQLRELSLSLSLSADVRYYNFPVQTCGWSVRRASEPLPDQPECALHRDRERETLDKSQRSSPLF